MKIKNLVVASLMVYFFTSTIFADDVFNWRDWRSGGDGDRGRQALIDEYRVSLVDESYWNFDNYICQLVGTDGQGVFNKIAAGNFLSVFEKDFYYSLCASGYSREDAISILIRERKSAGTEKNSSVLEKLRSKLKKRRATEPVADSEPDSEVIAEEQEAAREAMAALLGEEGAAEVLGKKAGRGKKKKKKKKE